MNIIIYNNNILLTRRLRKIKIVIYVYDLQRFFLLITLLYNIRVHTGVYRSIKLYRNTVDINP